MKKILTILLFMVGWVVYAQTPITTTRLTTDTIRLRILTQLPTHPTNGLKVTYWQNKVYGTDSSAHWRLLDIRDTASNLQYIKLSQSTPQTIINGIPLLDSNRTITLDHQLVDKKYVNEMMTGGVKSFFFTKTASDVGGMYKAVLDAPLGVIRTITTSALDGETEIGSFITDQIHYSYRVIEGSRFFHLTARVSSTAKPTQLKGYVYITDTLGGNQTLLRTSNLSQPLTALDAEYFTSVMGDALLISDTMRILFKIAVVKTGTGVNPDVTISLEDDTFSRLDVPSPVGVTDLTPVYDSLALFRDINLATKDPTGFVNNTTSHLTFTNHNRRFIINGAFTTYYRGMPTIRNADTLQITDVTGLHYIYYNAAGSLTEMVNSWPGFDNVLTAFIYWNATTQKGLMSWERHGIAMDWITHEYLHETRGAAWKSGNNATFGNTTFSISSGEWYDEDIEHLPGTKTTATVIYHSGSSEYAWDTLQTNYMKMNGANIRYNNGNALADVASNNYVAYWIFVTSDSTMPYVSLMGQRTDPNIADARANNKFELLTFGTLPFIEMKLLYRVILRNDGTPYEETADYRSTSAISNNTYVATAHNTLTGLTNDDHTQYQLSNGTRAETINAATTDLDKFVVDSSGFLKYRTGTEVLSDIGGMGSIDTSKFVRLGGRTGGQTIAQKVTFSFDSTLVTNQAYSSSTWNNSNAVPTKNAVRDQIVLLAPINKPTFTDSAMTADVAYNSSTWQGASKIPTQNAVRDKIESLAATIPSVTPAALTKTDDTNVTLTLGGTPATSLLQATSMTLGWTGTLADGRIASASNWNSAYGLVADTAKFVRLGGRTGGQTLNGGIGANDDITIKGTSSGTTTTSYVYLQPSGGIVDIAGRWKFNPDGSASWGAIGDYGYFNWDTNEAQIYGGASKRLSFGAHASHDLLVIDTTGNVGIGTTAPGAKLEVAGIGGFRIQARSIDPSYYTTFTSGYPGGLTIVTKEYNQPDGTMVIYHGNVGIGTVSPVEKLTVFGTVDAAPGTIALASIRNDAVNVELGRISGYQNMDETSRISLLRGDGGLVGQISFSVKENNDSILRERVRFDPFGNVGLGTTTPGAKIDIEDKTAGVHELIRLSHANAYDGGAKISWWMDNDVESANITSAWYPTPNAKSYISFSTYGPSILERLRINGDGNVGIGVTDPDAALEVNGTGHFAGIITSDVATGTSPFTLNSTTKVPYLNADYLDGFDKESFRRKIDCVPFSYDGTVHYWWNKVGRISGAYQYLNIDVYAQQNTDAAAQTTINNVNITRTGAGHVGVYNSQVVRGGEAYNDGEIDVCVDTNYDIWIRATVNWASALYYYINGYSSGVTIDENPTASEVEADPNAVIVKVGEQVVYESDMTLISRTPVGLVTYFGQIGLNTNVPTADFDINGTIRIRGGSPVAGRFLQCDANGLATWATVTNNYYKGTVNGTNGVPSWSGTALIDGTGTEGWYAACATAGTYNYGSGNITLAIGDQLIYQGAIWNKIPGAGSYTLPIATATLGGVITGGDISVNAGTGAVTVNKAAVLTTARTIGGTSFDGSANIKIGALSSTNVDATTSANLAGVLSDETGSGSVVFSASPTLSGTVSMGNSTEILSGASSTLYYQADYNIFRNALGTYNRATIDTSGMNMPTGKTYQVNSANIIATTISDGVTTSAPNQNVVYDALALKTDKAASAVQSLSAGGGTWDVTSGSNATITPSGNITLNITNLDATNKGLTGNLSVYPTAAAYTIHIHNHSGAHADDDFYVRVSTAVRSAAAQVTTTNAGFDMFSWYWDGEYLWVNGTKGYGT